MVWIPFFQGLQRKFWAEAMAYVFENGGLQSMAREKIADIPFINAFGKQPEFRCFEKPRYHGRISVLWIVE